MRLPKIWNTLSAGHYIHTKTGIEVRRDGRDWGVYLPHNNHKGPHAAHVGSRRTRGEAFYLAETEYVVPVLAWIREETAASWDDAHEMDADLNAQLMNDHSTAAFPLLYRRTDRNRIEADHDARADLVVNGRRTRAWYRATTEAFRERGEQVDAMVATLRLGDRVRRVDDEHGIVWTVDDIHTDRNGWVWLGLHRIVDGTEIGSGCQARAVDPVERATAGQHAAVRLARIGRDLRLRLITDEQYQAAERQIRLDEQTERAEAFDAAMVDYARAAERRQAAVAAGRPGNWERQQKRIALLALLRAELALHIAKGQAPGVARIVTIEHTGDGGATWELTYAETAKASPRETETDQAWRFAADYRLAEKELPCRVRVYTDPDAVVPAGQWLGLTDPCEPGTHRTVPATLTPGVAGGTDLARCERCGHPLWRAASPVGAPAGWVLEGDQLPGADGLPNGLPAPVDQTGRPPRRTRRRARGRRGTGRGRGRRGGLPDGLGLPLTGLPGGLQTIVPVHYRIETQTAGGWRSIQTGQTPPMHRPVYPNLVSTADTIFSNMRSVLGLGGHETVPATRVQTWFRTTGQTRSEIRNR